MPGTGPRAIHVGRRDHRSISGLGKPKVTIADMAADCRVVMDALGVVPSHVVGASFSCVVALVLVLVLVVRPTCGP